MIQRDYGDYIQDIFQSINDIESFIKNSSPEQFLVDKKTSLAVCRSLEIIGEAAKQIPENVRQQYPNIPFKKLAGLRDKLIHAYHEIDHRVIWDIITNDLPPIKPAIKKLLDQFPSL